MSSTTSVATARRVRGGADGSRLLAGKPQPARNKPQPARHKEPARSKPQPAQGTVRLLEDDSLLLGCKPQPARDRPPSETAQLLGDKLRIPRLSLAVLRRRRLIDLIEQAARHRVTVVSGPAGAGKTVACASWAAATAGPRRVAWLTLDAYDREPARFWACLQASLAGAAAARAGALRSLQDSPADGDFPLRLVEAAQLLTEPVTVVFDDIHELAGSHVLPGLDLLIRHAPPALRLILVGRCPPRLQLARMRVAGELADVGSPDLACTVEEADAYFAMLGIQVAAAERDELLRRTEGWMAGLRLAAMSARAAPQERGRFTRIAGDLPIVTDYLWDEVLGRQPPETRLLMLRTSLTEQTSGDLAYALTGEPGGGRTLERLSRENSFVEAIGDDHAAYRYHPLLRDVLRAQLRREIPHEIPILLSRAARWHAAHGDALAAVRAAAQAADFDYAAHVLSEAGTAALMRADTAALEQVLALFPAERCASDPAVAAALAATRLWIGDPDGAMQHLDRAGRSLARCAPAVLRVIEPSLAALRVMQAASRPEAETGLLAEGWALAEQAQGSCTSVPEHRALGLLWFALGTARLRRWEVDAARHALRQADRQLGAGGLGELRARARGWQALAQAWDGELTAAQQAAAELGAGLAASEPAAVSLAALASAQVCLARDDLAGARRLLDEAGERPFGQLPGEPRTVALAALTRARIDLAAGDAAGARGLLLRLRDTSAERDPRLAELLTVLDSEIAVHTGDTARARSALAGLNQVAQRDRGASVDQAAHSGRGDVAVLRSRLLLADGDFTGALAVVQPCLDGTAEAVTLPVKIAALVAAAIASRRLGGTETAAELLGQALALAEPDQAYRVFLDAGQPARSAITLLVPPTSRCANFAGRILERFDSQLHHAERRAGQAETLTQSEVAVLRFLPSQMTNQEIAEALFLSINTVKTHLRSVYRKLAVTSRRQAIARGRQLELL